MLLRSTIATGMQQATAKAATSPPTSRTASIGRAKKNRSSPSAIVMTAKHSNAPRPRTTSACASNLVARSIRAIAVTAPAVPVIRGHDHAQKMPARRKVVLAVLSWLRNGQPHLLGSRGRSPKVSLALVFRPHFRKFGVQRGLQFLVPRARRHPFLADRRQQLLRLVELACDGKTTLFFGLLFSFSRLAAL